MATDGQMPAGPGSNLEILRQRAQKAAEFYQQQQQQQQLLQDLSEEVKIFPLLPGDLDPRSTKQYLDNYNSNHSVGAHYSSEGGPGMTRGSAVFSSGMSRVLSDDSFEALSSSSSFYRGKMRAGIMDMRSSYNERMSGNGARVRTRALPGPNADNRTRTQTYALENNHSPPSQQPKSKAHLYSQQQQLSAPQKPARTYTTNRAIVYRSSSDLEMDSGEVDAPPPAPAVLHREYGSASSLDVLGTSADNNFFSMLSEFRQQHALDQRSPAPPRLRELLQGRLESVSEPQIQLAGESSKGAGVHALNGLTSNEKDFSGDDSDPLKSSKNKSKHKERKQRAKSITGEGSASILKKLRGKIDTDPATVRSEDKGVSTEEVVSKNEEHTRRLAFVHFDCQSVGVDLSKVIYQHLHGGAYKSNTTTGASAASGQRTSLAPDKDDPELIVETDEGDGKSNELVLSCIFFRNELGGEDERTVSLTKLTAQKLIAGSCSSFLQPTVGYITQVRHPACCGVAILDSSPSPSGQILPPLVSHRGHVIEYVDHGAYYYRHFFYTHDHQNIFGTDENLGPVAISIRREKLDLEDRTNNLGRADYGTAQYRIICRTSELTTLRGCILEDAIPSRLSSSRGMPIKDVLEVAVPEVQLSCLRHAVAGQKTCEQLLKLDEQGISNTYKVGIMYCKAGQSTEEDMYNNEHSGPAFEEFLNLISQKVRLKGFEKYRAGLDCKTDTTGTHSYYTTFSNNEIMFHVSTMLPYTTNNKQQLLRKRHIGNDIVTIVFQEPGALPFTPQTVRSQFQHVFIIIRVSSPNTDSTRYSIAIARSKDVPAFGPHIPAHCSFKKSPEFVDFLLAKVINAENAAHKSDKFLAMATRTRQEYLKDLATNYTTNTLIDAGSKLSKFGLGSGRKKEKPKQKVVPDMFAKGALVWEVQVEDIGAASQVECLLAIAADTIVLVEQTNKDVIFTIPCSTVMGWTPQPSSLRLYFGAGECLLLRPLSGEAEEMQEIITRLQAVTNGTETSKMALKRNGMGQLGFHIQSEGIVTDVEPYGFAWEAGLRKGSRLVEICKVATTTLSHDQIVDLLRTSSTVKVVVVPPVEDGSPRGDNTLSTNLTTTPNTGKQSPSSQQSYYQQPPAPHLQPTPASEASPRARHHGYSDSTLSSGRSSDEGRNSYFSHTRQELAEMYGSMRSSHESHTSSGEEPHSRSNSHDSTDYSMSGSSVRSQTGQNSQPIRRGERLVGMADGMDGLPYGSSSQGSGTSKRQFPNSEFPSGIPITGNISLELLKQTQNTKFLLGQGQGRPLPDAGRQPHDASHNPGSTTNLSQISESSSQFAPRRDAGRLKEEPRRKDLSQSMRLAKPVMKKGYTEPPAASPRATRRNLSGMSSEESLTSRLRPGAAGQKLVRQVAKTDFQEELMRLIDPDLSEKDLVGIGSRTQSSQKSSRLQRTLSDESLQNSKLNNNETTQPPSTDTVTQRLSPRAVSDLANARQRSKSTVDNRLPILESAAALDWSKLVNVASKAIDESDSGMKHKSMLKDRSASRDGCPEDGQDEAELDSLEDRAPPRPPSPQLVNALSSSGMTSSFTSSSSSSPRQRIQELEQRLTQMALQLDKAQHEKTAMEAEIQELRADNVRLQEESQTAASQLRRFTEWFFNTIDRQ